ncbi:unnamed protein product, partial [Chrysoparadoxa australica]
MEGDEDLRRDTLALIKEMGMAGGADREEGNEAKKPKKKSSLKKEASKGSSRSVGNSAAKKPALKGGEGKKGREASIEQEKEKKTATIAKGKGNNKTKAAADAQVLAKHSNSQKQLAGGKRRGLPGKPSSVQPDIEIKPLSLKLKHPACSLNDTDQRWFAAVPVGFGEGQVKNVKGGAKGKKKTKGKAEKADEGAHRAPPKLVASLKQLAGSLFESEVEAWQERRYKSMNGDDRWVEQVLKSGTLSDKLAALIIQAQESPLHRLSSMDRVLEMATKKERRTSQMALEALKDLFINDLLPADRQLVAFEARPLMQIELWAEQDQARAGKALILWWFEDLVRQRYGRILDAIQAATGDTVSNYKRFGMETAKDLLVERPEGEARLLALLVNKFGDPDSAVSNKAIHLVQQVLRKHPAMKGVVVREVQQYVHRPGLAPRALYAGIIFLNQVYLRKDVDADLAGKLVDTYFRLFERAVSSGDLKSRLLSALLTGVNRAQPYMADAVDGLGKHVDELFRIVHQSNFSTSTQALMLLFQIVAGQMQRSKAADGAPEPAAVTRFYTALYAKLNSSDLLSTSMPVLLLNLMFKALKLDKDMMRVTAMLKRLLQAGVQGGAPLAAAVLFVTSEVMKKHQALRGRVFATDSAATLANGSGEGSESSPPPVAASSRNPAHPLHPHRLGYDATKRDPRFACGSSPSLLWEVALLSNHFHPSVQHFSRQLLTPPGHGIRYKGDPLTDFSMMAFLDKMAYKNAKKPKAHSLPGTPGDRQATVQEADFVQQPQETVSAEQVFFHKYFREKSARDKAKGVGKKKPTDGQDIDADALDFDQDSDPEEAAFARTLAEGLMRTAGGSAIDLDDEDPDMEGWSDLDDSEDEGDEESHQQDDSDDADADADDADDADEDADEDDGVAADDADAFMSEASSDDGSGLEESLASEDTPLVQEPKIKGA